MIDSKQRWYGGGQGTISRTAGWMSQTLYTERATRDARGASAPAPAQRLSS